MRLALISCRVFQREMQAAMAHSMHDIRLHLLPMELHDLDRAAFRARLQSAVDGADAGADAVLLGYGLCGNAILGLRAGRVPLVIPRAHDCLALFFGGERRCREYMLSHPGTFFRTCGWLDQPRAAARLAGHYSNLAYLQTVPDPGREFERMARREAEEAGWQFDALAGDLSIIQKFVNGEWNNQDFLVVHPDEMVAATYDERVISAAGARLPPINPAGYPA